MHTYKCTCGFPRYEAIHTEEYNIGRDIKAVLLGVTQHGDNVGISPKRYSCSGGIDGKRLSNVCDIPAFRASRKERVRLACAL